MDKFKTPMSTVMPEDIEKLTVQQLKVTNDPRLFQIPLDQIKLMPNSRKTYHQEELASLMVSLRQTGLLSPIGVKQNHEGQFEIIFGFRRFMAAQKLSWKTIDAILIDAKTEVDRIIMNTIENVQRASVSFVEQGENFKELLKMGLTNGEIAARIGKPPFFVRDCLLAFEQIPKRFQEKISVGTRGQQNKKGQVAMSNALAIVNMSKLGGVSRPQLEELLEWGTKDKIQRQHINTAGRLIAGGATVKEAINRSEKMTVLHLTVSIETERMKRLEKKYDVRIHDIIYSWLEQNHELDLTSASIAHRDKVIVHTRTKKRNG